MIGWDQETYQFCPGVILPPVVCGTFSYSRNLKATRCQARHQDLFEETRAALRMEFTGANVAYDLGCAMKTWPSLTPEIFAALHEYRAHDVQIREGLINLAGLGEVSQDGSLQNLAQLMHKYLGVVALLHRPGCTDPLNCDCQKNAPWRLLFSELDGVDPAGYPPEALLYAQTDAWAAREVHIQQDDPPTEGLHVAAAFCYTLMTEQGLDVDRRLKRRLQKQVEKELSPSALHLLYEGKNPLVVAACGPKPHAGGHKAHTPGCSREKASCVCPVQMIAPTPERVAKGDALIPRVLRVVAEQGLTFERCGTKGHEHSKLYTCPSDRFPNGQVKTDEETVALLSGFDPVLAQFHTRMEKDKLRTAYFPALEWPFHSGRTARRVYPGYETLKKTGRGSSRGTTKKKHSGCSCYTGIPCANASYPSLNVQQADPRVRACYLPGPEGECG